MLRALILNKNVFYFHKQFINIVTRERFCEMKAKDQFPHHGLCISVLKHVMKLCYI